MDSTPANQPTPSAEELAVRLRAALSALIRTTRPIDRLAPIPAGVLDLLDVRGAMTTADLAASRGVRHQTMAATVKELTDAGYLSAEPDPGDARKKVLSLTTSGRSALDADRRQRVGVLAEALEKALDEDERRIMAHALHLIDRLTGTVEDARHPRSAGDGPITGAW